MNLDRLVKFMANKAKECRQLAETVSNDEIKHQATKDADDFALITQLISDKNSLFKSSEYELGINIASGACMQGFFRIGDMPPEGNNLRDFWVLGNNLSIAVELFKIVETMNDEFIKKGMPFLSEITAAEIRQFIEVNTPEETIASDNAPGSAHV